MHLAASSTSKHLSLLEELQAQHGAEISSLLVNSSAARAQLAIAKCDDFLDLRIAPTSGPTGTPPVLVFLSMRWDRDITEELHRLFARYVSAGHIDIASPMAETVGDEYLHATNPRSNLPLRFAINSNNLDAVTALVSHGAPHKHPSVNPEASDNLLTYIDEAYGDHPTIAKRIKAAAQAGQRMSGDVGKRDFERLCTARLTTSLGTAHFNLLEWLLSQVNARATHPDVLHAIRRCGEYVAFGTVARSEHAEPHFAATIQFIESVWPTQYRAECASLLQRYIDAGMVGLDEPFTLPGSRETILPLEYAIRRGNTEAVSVFVANSAPHAVGATPLSANELLTHIETSQKGKWWPKDLMLHAARRGLESRRAAA